MSRVNTMAGRTALFLIVLISAGLFSREAYAFGSKEKSPQEQAQENQKKGIAVYNEGVKEMEHGRAIAAGGDSVYAYNYRATSDAKAKKSFEKAADLFNKAVKYDPKMAEAYNNLGYCYRKLGKLDQSLDAYQKALMIKDDFAQAREYRGETYLALGRLDLAQADQQFLSNMHSPLADTLSKSIELYQLEQINKKASGK